jgi:hypothetical protein
LISPEIVGTAKVVNSRPRSGSKRSIAPSSAMLAIWARSSYGSAPRR